jgi:hypothetical protein
MAALGGAVERSVGTATHYHADYVVPYWAWSLDKITTIGTHIFYRWKGYWGRRSAFNGIYAGEGEQSGTPAQLPGIPIDVSALTVQVPRVPSGPRPLADDLGRIGSGQEAADALKFQPRADQEHGSLVADENAGKLVAPSPAGN